MRHRDEGGSARRRARRARTRDARREHRRDTTRDSALHACTRTSRASTPRRSSSPRGGVRSETMRPEAEERSRGRLDGRGARGSETGRSRASRHDACADRSRWRPRGRARGGLVRARASRTTPIYLRGRLRMTAPRITRAPSPACAVRSVAIRDPISLRCRIAFPGGRARALLQFACQSTRRIQHPRCNPSRQREGAPPSVPRGESGRESGSRVRSRALRRRATLARPDPTPLPPARRVPGRTIGHPRLTWHLG